MLGPTIEVSKAMTTVRQRLAPLKVPSDHPLLSDKLALDLGEDDLVVNQAYLPLLQGGQTEQMLHVHVSVDSRLAWDRVAEAAQFFLLSRIVQLMIL